ncbi:DUF3299 domain-containing protein [Mesorhizobium sp. AaZ16]
MLPGTIQAGEVAGRHIDWSNLRPKGQGEDNAIFPGVAASRVQGETLSDDLAGIVVRIDSYVLPIDRDRDLVYEFLLVPWLGACSHAPQPPPNQMVHVIPSVPFRIERAYEFVSVVGTLRSELEKTQLFIMDGPTVLTSGYGIGKANIDKSATPPAEPSFSARGVAGRQRVVVKSPANDNTCPSANRTSASPSSRTISLSSIFTPRLASSARSPFPGVSAPFVINVTSPHSGRNRA